jgi:DNA helicase-2/ATP-dependent DNA helicase PcrA
MTLPAPKISDIARAAPPYLAGLNPEQRTAVEALDGPVLVLAGAGTGKTRVLTTRLAHILATGRAWPSQILSVTFTNKAAREMKERVARIIGPAAEGLPWLGTFHSVAAQILRRKAELADLRSNFTILDVDDQLRLMKQVIQAEGIDEKRWPPRLLAATIDAWKNKGLAPEKVPEGERFAFAEGKGVKLYRLYQERLQTLNAVDFGDLLLLNIKIFQENPEVLAEFHDRFRYILVDEYQDTNVAQYLWLRLLARGHGNLCVVGDDDQAIYGWRGAEVDNILRFEKDFPGAKVIRLERNYRSTAPILAAASGLIAANRGRLGKTLWTEALGGEKVRVRGVWDGEAEARMVAEEIETWRKLDHDGKPDGDKKGRYADCAVLVRAAWQMRAFEDRFLTLGVPYKVIGGPRFFERAEIRDAHAYFRLVRSEDDDLAFERIVNTPKRGVGDSTVQKLQLAARAAGTSLAKISAQMVQTDEIRGAARTGLKTFLQDLARWRDASLRMRHDELAELVLDECGYTVMLKEDKSPQAAVRLDNLKELVSSMGEFDSLEAYLEHVALVMDREQADTGDEVWLMTLHAAKGLEFPLVFLPGWEETVFPSQRALEEKGASALEEERRLAYVGLTRARTRALISFAANRQIYGRWQSVLPSRFIDELPPDHVDAGSDTGYFGAEGASVAEPINPMASSYSSPGWRRLQQARDSDRGRRPPPTVEGEARLIAKDDEESRFKLGERVFHMKFGYGRVRTIEGNKLTVDFEKAGQKKVIESFLEKT